MVMKQMNCLAQFHVWFVITNYRFKDSGCPSFFFALCIIFHSLLFGSTVACLMQLTVILEDP